MDGDMGVKQALKPSGETSKFPPGMGIEFRGIRDEGAEMLRNLIRKTSVEVAF